MTWLIINWTKYLKIPAKFELRYLAVSAIPIPTTASYTTSFSIPGSPDSNQRGSGASLRALCLAAITEPCVHVFVGSPQCWLSPFRAVSCHVILFLTLLGSMWLHIMLLPFKNQKHCVSSQFPRSQFQTFPSSRLHLTLITLLGKFQLIKENDLNSSTQTVSSVSSNILFPCLLWEEWILPVVKINHSICALSFTPAFKKAIITELLVWQTYLNKRDLEEYQNGEVSLLNVKLCVYEKN